MSNDKWKSLYKIGGTTALILLLYSLVSMVILVTIGGQPETTAGEAILASDMWHGLGAIVGGILLHTGALPISLVMLRNQTFAKSTAYVGMVMHGLDFVHTSLDSSPLGAALS